VFLSDTIAEPSGRKVSPQGIANPDVIYSSVSTAKEVLSGGANRPWLLSQLNDTLATITKIDKQLFINPILRIFAAIRDS
jgi:hypothetical protein